MPSPDTWTMGQGNDRRARNAFKNILGGVAGGGIVAAHQEYGLFFGLIAGAVIFLITVVSYRVADELYGHPQETTRSPGDS